MTVALAIFLTLLASTLMRVAIVLLKMAVVSLPPDQTGAVLQMRLLRDFLSHRFEFCCLTPHFGLLYGTQDAQVSPRPDAAETQHSQLQYALRPLLVPAHAAELEPLRVHRLAARLGDAAA